MKYTIRLAPEAQQQLDAIDNYVVLASGYRTVSEQFVDDIVAYCESSETFFERGMQRDELLPGLRTVGYGWRVTVACRVDSNSRAVVILGVFDGGQDFEAEIAHGDPDRSDH